jgi:preprotein translocase subunit YajC
MPGLAGMLLGIVVLPVTLSMMAYYSIKRRRRNRAKEEEEK